MAKLKVFLSYRRDDIHGVAQGIVGRIYDRLEDHYGDGNVFMDIDAIPPGVNFAEYLDSWVAEADIFLVVIGPQWADLLRARRDDPRDFVRIEIEAALARGIPVVPLLLRGAKMPGPDVLTGSLARLGDHQAFVIDDGRDFKTHLARLLRDLDRHYSGRKPAAKPTPKPQPAPAPKAQPKQASPPPPSKPKAPGPDRRGFFVASAITLIGLVAVVAWPRGGDPAARAIPEPVPVPSGVAPGLHPWPHVEPTLVFAPPPSGRSLTLSPLPPPSTQNPEPATNASFTNTLGMKFVPVPGTKILMSIWETRVQDYAAYAAANPEVDDEWKDYEFLSYKQGPDHPVVNVSWEDAQAFCQWLSKKEGKSYRLPTDAEWSCAVGIGDQESATASPSYLNSVRIRDVYPWGSGWPPPKGAGNFHGEEGAVSGLSQTLGFRDEHPVTAPVGSYLPNKLGIYDLGGNVWEWCEDSYSWNSDFRVLRGASWVSHYSGFLRSSFRGMYAAWVRSDVSGFRLVGVGSGER